MKTISEPWGMKKRHPEGEFRVLNHTPNREALSKHVRFGPFKDFDPGTAGRLLRDPVQAYLGIDSSSEAPKRRSAVLHRDCWDTGGRNFCHTSGKELRRPLCGRLNPRRLLGLAGNLEEIDETRRRSTGWGWRGRRARCWRGSSSSPPGSAPPSTSTAGPSPSLPPAPTRWGPTSSRG